MTTAVEQTTERTEKAADRRKALGRGLDSLLPGGPRVVAGTAIAVASSPAAMEGAASPEQRAWRDSGDAVAHIPLEQIDENPYQTRQTFDPSALRELADSISVNGVIQPIVVRPKPDGRFLLILGERRCRASKLAGKTSISAIVRTVSDGQAAEMTIVENLQRQDLNCLEQANAFARLSREFGLTQEQIGQRTGCSRESVSNYMRLLKLPEEVQRYLAGGLLGFSEARVLLQILDPDSITQIAKHAVEKKMSVARLTELVDRINLPPQAPGEPTRKIDPNVRAAQSELERALGVKVHIHDRSGKGKIVIEYASLEDFDRVVEMLGRRA